MSYFKKNIREIEIWILLVLSQELVYFGTKFLQPYQIVLNNSIDNKIPFIPEFVHFYYIWYILLLIVPFFILKYSKKNFYNYILTCFVFVTVELLCFIAFPTTLIRYNFEVNSFSTWMVNLIYRYDTPVYNLCPSGHCSYSILFAIAIFDTSKIKIDKKILMVIISTGIILSTLFIKQHVLLDILCSFIIIPIYIFVKKQSIDLERIWNNAKIFRKTKN